MLNENQLLKLGYEVNEDPDQPGWFYWRNDAIGGSEISYDSKDAAIWEAGQDALATLGELHQCDNCGAMHESDKLLLAKDLGMRVDPGGVMPSGECPECGALCYPIEEDPDWETVMDYFGLDHSFQYGHDDIRNYTLQYHESIAAQESEVDAGRKAVELLAQADSYLREIRAENLDGSEPELGKLLEQITTFWIESGRARNQPVEDTATGAVQVSLDGGETYRNAPNGVRIVYRDMPIPGEDEDGELHINATSEGLVMDVWVTKDEPAEYRGETDFNLGTSSQMATDIVASLVEAND